MKSFLSVLIFFMTGAFCWADKGLLEDFDSLGENSILFERAQALKPEVRVEIVQQRIVNRNQRHEISPEFGVVSSGNTYLNSSNLGLSYNYHFNPRWTVGAKYKYYFNELTGDGRRALDEGVAFTNNDLDFSFIPELNWIRTSVQAQAAWHPIYGKINLFDRGVVHFDIYTFLGGGRINLRKGSSLTYLGGLGSGFWISQHLTSRIEYSYQTYEAEFNSGSKRINNHAVNLSLGYML